MKLVIIGFGAVGQGVARVIQMKKEELSSKYGIKLQIVAVTDTSGAALSSQGLDPQILVDTKNKTGKISEYPGKGHANLSGLDVLEMMDYDCLVEVTPTNIEDAEPAHTHILTAMEQKKHVVTSNKGPLALYFRELADKAQEKDVEFRYEASVGGAMPIINFARETLSGCEIRSVYGILNGTTNYILSRMAKEGSSYQQTLKEAQEMGIAETDPTQDVEGIDAACKVAILANCILGMDATLEDVKVEGITRITSESIALAKREGLLIKLIGEVSPHTLEVAPRLVREGSPFAVDGTLNVATLDTDLAEEVTVVGKGAGSIETASAILSDLISIGNK